MKTIREMMDQLDEISRRDFLKGAGVAALGGGAALGYQHLNRGLKVATSGGDLQVAIVSLMYLYYVCKTNPDSPETQKYASMIKSMISDLISDNPDFKQYVNDQYKHATEWMSTGDYKLIKSKEESVWALRDKTIARFNRIYQEAKRKYGKGMKQSDEFNEDQIEEASPEAIANIHKLSQQ